VGGEPGSSSIGNETLGVIVLVASHGPSPYAFGEPFEHLGGAVSFGESGRGGEVGVDDQRGTMFDQQCPA
jgi:hypothetical protein